MLIVSDKLADRVLGRVIYDPAACSAAIQLACRRHVQRRAMTAESPSRSPQPTVNLPDPPNPAASYASVRRKDDLLFISGQLPFVDGVLPISGKLGREMDTNAGQEQARVAMLNAIAVAARAAGDVRALRAIQLTIFVASDPNYLEQHIVANGASETLMNLLGERGQHARTTVATPCLAMNAPIEVQALFQVLPASKRAADLTT